MRTFRLKYRIGLCNAAFLFIFTTWATVAQEFQLVGQESSLKVFGTSSLHDWHIVAENINGAISFTNIEEAKLDKCQMSIVSESFKSGKKSMDKNTYNALKTDEYSKITFRLKKVKSIKPSPKNSFELIIAGDLSIAGTNKEIELTLNAQIDKDVVKLSGEKSLKMTDFNVEPPKALFGTITTGDEVKINFETTFK